MRMISENDKSIEDLELCTRMVEDDLLSHKEVAIKTILNLEEAASLFYINTKEVFEKHG